jgi:peroxiredoxin
MASLQTPVCNLGWEAAGFNLPGTDGNNWTLGNVRGEKGTLVMFICNHCPYVKSILPRLVADLRELKALGVNTIAIMSNDVSDYPEDSFENMQAIATGFDFPFPYVQDESQSVAKRYGAVCTPDFFGFDADLKLRYRGRFDESRKEAAVHSTRDLFNAMKLVAETGQGPKDQIPGIGCSIKWKNNTE